MAILVDWQIQQLCTQSKLVAPYHPSLVNPASIDVRVGTSAYRELHSGEWLPVELDMYSEDCPFWIAPKEFILVGTLERLTLPSQLSAEFRIKSSRAREGYSNLLAMWVDPGFTNSVLTMELVNERRYGRLPLYPGLRIGQMIFSQTAGTPQMDYLRVGRYNHDLVAQLSKG